MRRPHFVAVLAVLGLAALVLGFVLLHVGATQTIRGTATDPDDPDAPGESVALEVRCESPTSGPRLGDDGAKRGVRQQEGDDPYAEDDSFVLSYEGLDVATISDVCGRTRTERVAHAVELGVLGLVLGGGAVLVARDGRRPRRETRTTTGNAAPPPPSAP